MQQQAETPKVARYGVRGQSKYAKKIQERRRAARKLGLRRDATWPEIWAAMKEQED